MARPTEGGPSHRTGVTNARNRTRTRARTPARSAEPRSRPSPARTPAPSRSRATTPTRRAAPGNVTAGRGLSAEQQRNANTIVAVGRKMGMSERDIQTGLMAALVESNLINVNYGDRDSLGLFQQRPSQGWGTPTQVRNPTYAATKFFNGLKGVKNRNSISMGQAAQRVQRSAFPARYDTRTAQAANAMRAAGANPVASNSAPSGGGAGAPGAGRTGTIPAGNTALTSAPRTAAAGITPSATVRKKTAADYGYIDAFLKAHPDVKAMVDKAADQDWTPTRLQAAIKSTGWWKSRSEAQRNYDLMRAENPREAERQVAYTFRQMRQMSGEMGVSIGTKALQEMARKATENKWSEAETKLQLSLLFNVGTKGTGEEYRGDAGETVDVLTRLSADFGVTLSNPDLQRFTRQVLAGEATIEGLTDHFREQAKVLYPQISKDLDAGMTTQTYLAPFLSIAQNELGITNQRFDLADSKWTAALSGADGKPMSADQWTQKLRTESRYGWDKTVNARAQGAELANQFGRMFGAIG